MPVAPGDVVDGKVAKLVKFGIIVSLPEGRSGLVHISEIADSFVRDVGDYFEEGDAVKVKIVGTDEKGRLQLSAKQAEPRAPIRAVEPDPRPTPGPQRPLSASFEERLSSFMKSSEQRLVEIKRSRDAKRKKRRRR
jgi:S1 RNA binding domain protein